MSNGHPSRRFEISRFSLRRCHSQLPPQRAGDLHYRHILAPTGLEMADRAALQLGFKLAAAHGAKLTVLHVLPTVDRACHGLDAIGLLHDVADELHVGPRSGRANETAPQRLRQFVNEAVSPVLREAVNWQMELRSGEVARTIADYANGAAADLVILSTRPAPWWLPIASASVRTVERRARGNVLVLGACGAAHRRRAWHDFLALSFG